MKVPRATYWGLMLLFFAFLISPDEVWMESLDPHEALTDVSWVAGLRPSEHLKHHFEQVRLVTRNGRKSLGLSGWGLVPGQGNSGKQLVVLMRSEDRLQEFMGAAATMEMMPREGLRTTYGTQDDPFLGFGAAIPLEVVPEGRYTLGLAWIGPAGRHVGWSQRRITRTAEGIADGIVSVAAPAAADQPGTTMATFNVERVAATGKFLAASGWAFFDGQDTDSLRHFLVLESPDGQAAYDSAKVTRWGVHAQKSQAGEYLADCGFDARVPLGDIAPGSYRVKLLLDDGIRRAIVESQFDIEVHADGAVDVSSRY